MTSDPQMTPHDTPTQPRRRPRLLVRIARTVVVLIMLVVVWFAVVRLTAPWRMVRIIEDPSVPRAVDARPDTLAARLRPGTLRIGTWNISHGHGLAEGFFPDESREAINQRVLDIARVIAEHDLDIVILNEIDFDCTWSGRANQAQMIARAAGYRWRVEQRNVDTAVPFFALRFGNAILSRHPIVDAAVVDHPWYNHWEPLIAGKKRGCLATIELADGSRAQAAAVHLDNRWHGGYIRDESLRNVASARDPALPLITAGDFNVSLPGFPKNVGRRQTTTSLSRFLDEAALQTAPMNDPQPYDFTFRAPEPDRVIDWILVPREWTIVSRKVVRNELSDHLLVVMEVEVDLRE